MNNNNLPLSTSAIEQIVAQFGKQIFDRSESAKLEGLLSDFMTGDNATLKLFRKAIKEGIAHELLQSDGLTKAEKQIKLNTLKTKFKEDNFLEGSIAFQVVDSFANALGWAITDKNAKRDSSPNPKPKSKPVPSNEQNFTDKFGIEMIAVEGGTFRMGTQNTDRNKPNYDADASDNESPVHKVTLSDFFIGKYPVTQAQWKAVMGKNPSEYKGNKRPVENVSWYDVQEFISKLNQQTGKNYRLPTEAEWEFAARGGNQSRGYKYSGSNTTDSVAWYEDNSGDKTHPVGTKQANELGIYDMSGNVHEWCNDDWFDDYSSGSQTNPKGANSGSYHITYLGANSSRVIRGGSWLDGARNVRVSSRNGYYIDSGDDILGFRLAASSKQVKKQTESQIDSPKIEGTYLVSTEEERDGAHTIIKGEETYSQDGTKTMKDYGTPFGTDDSPFGTDDYEEPNPIKWDKLHFGRTWAKWSPVHEIWYIKGNNHYTAWSSGLSEEDQEVLQEHGNWFDLPLPSNDGRDWFCSHSIYPPFIDLFFKKFIK